MIRAIKIVSFCVIGIAGFFQCSQKPLAFGNSSSETTNGYILGLLVKTDGSPAAETEVRLIPNSYDPVKDGPVPDSLKDTTDEGGDFVLHASGAGEFNIEGIQRSSGDRVLITGVLIGKNDTVTVPPSMIRKPGMLKVFLPSAAADNNGYLYCPGTTFWTGIADGTAIIDSVSAGFFPALCYVNRTDTARNRIVKTNFAVAPGSATFITDNHAWGFSRDLYLNTTSSGAAVNGNVYSFPLLVRLTADKFDFSQAKSGGEDVRFIKADGSTLCFEIERWDPAAQQAEIWVKVDTVYANDNAHYFTMLWGDPSATGTSNGSEVFDTNSGFAGVWHLGQPGGSIIPDATANGNNGTATATTTVGGAVGMAQMFDGKSSLIRVSGPDADKLNFPENGAFSVSAWVQTNVLDSVFHGVVYKSNEQYGLQMRPTNKWEFCTYIDNTKWEMSRASATDYSWHALVGVRNGTKQYLYVDGVSVDTSVAILASNLARVTDQPLDIGHCPDGGTNPDRFFNGIIDEVRISKIALGADWIKLCYMNQKQPDALVKW